MIRTLQALAIMLVGTIAYAGAASASDGTWTKTVEKARGQEVYWNAWGGGEVYNRYIGWVAARVREEYGIVLNHVKIGDTAEAVRKVLAERTAGRITDGSVDLIWINGENFKAMKDNALLYGPFVDRLPNFALVDTEEKPTTVLDFTVPTDGLEARGAWPSWFSSMTAPRWQTRRAQSRRFWSMPAGTRAVSPIPPRRTSPGPPF